LKERLVANRRRSAEEQREIREDVFQWLDDKLASGLPEVTRMDLVNYTFRGERIPLLDQGRGIRNPVDFDSTLTIMTSSKSHPYNDGIEPDGTIRYSFRAHNNADNRKLREAMYRGDPLVYLYGVRDGAYVPLYPVYVVGEDPSIDAVTLVIGEAHFLGSPSTWTPDARRYAERTVRQRMHQPLFRSRVLRAYESQCAICNLKHPELLDAAHIISDTSSTGVATVGNGLALCKIHHASYDRNFMGISPDYKVHVNRDLLDEVDGPMLKHGLQEMNGHTILLPKRVMERPERDRLARRFDEFIQRSA
jgi:putative restriction endonuclease